MEKLLFADEKSTVHISRGTATWVGDINKDIPFTVGAELGIGHLYLYKENGRCRLELREKVDLAKRYGAMAKETALVSLEHADELAVTALVSAGKAVYGKLTGMSSGAMRHVKADTHSGWSADMAQLKANDYNLIRRKMWEGSIRDIDRMAQRDKRLFLFRRRRPEVLLLQFSSSKSAEAWFNSLRDALDF